MPSTVTSNIKSRFTNHAPTGLEGKPTSFEICGQSNMTMECDDGYGSNARALEPISGSATIDLFCKPYQTSQAEVITSSTPSALWPGFPYRRSVAASHAILRSL